MVCIKNQHDINSNWKDWTCTLLRKNLLVWSFPRLQDPCFPFHRYLRVTSVLFTLPFSNEVYNKLATERIQLTAISRRIKEKEIEEPEKKCAWLAVVRKHSFVFFNSCSSCFSLLPDVTYINAAFSFVEICSLVVFQRNITVMACCLFTAHRGFIRTLLLPTVPYDNVSIFYFSSC